MHFWYSSCIGSYSSSISLSESRYHAKIEEHFTASYQEYTIEQFVGFLMDTNISKVFRLLR